MDMESSHILDIKLERLLPAIKALKFFSYQVRAKRGFSEKERKKIIKFIIANSHLDDGERSLLDTWLKNLRKGVGFSLDDTDRNYQRNLNSIPDDLKFACRAAAFDIGRGSGRLPTSPWVTKKIESEYPDEGVGIAVPWTYVFCHLCGCEIRPEIVVCPYCQKLLYQP